MLMYMCMRYVCTCVCVCVNPGSTDTGHAFKVWLTVMPRTALASCMGLSEAYALAWMELLEAITLTVAPGSYREASFPRETSVTEERPQKWHLGSH